MDEFRLTIGRPSTQTALRKAVAAQGAPGRYQPPRAAQGHQRPLAAYLAAYLAHVPGDSRVTPWPAGDVFAGFSDQRTRIAGKGEAG